MLSHLITEAAEKYPKATAVVAGELAWTYRQLADEGARIAQALRELGVGPSERVAIWMRKSPQTVAAMHAVSLLGAVYVPLDPVGPIQRAATIARDCAVSALVHDRPESDPLPEALENIPAISHRCGVDTNITWDELQAYPAILEPVTREPRDLAFILYTSGSTGTPKGVCISNENALAFINWAASEVGVTSQDRLSSHAPFHFDLSVFDLYAAFSRGASVYLIPESITYLGRALDDFIHENGITIWYSVPTAIMMMCDDGEFLEARDPSLRVLIFAGEVFPVKNLAAVQNAHQNLRLLNFFGPTETNVCTFHEVVEDLQDRDRPVPIGRVCSGNEAWAQDDDGKRVSTVGHEGELIIRGPTVMAGYWGKEPIPAGHSYATGDLVRLLEDGGYYYLGRKDNMVKIQGFRVELGEIEAVLGRFEGIRKCAVVVRDNGARKEIIAFVRYEGEKDPSLIQLKMHCASALPRYMVIQHAKFLEEFPRTPNGKIDRLTLKKMATEDV